MKIRGFTLFQLGMMALGAVVGFGAFTLVPKEWKIGNLPTGFLVGLTVFSVLLVLSNALEMKPIAWWRNTIFYYLKVLPTVFLPHPEEKALYPDPTIVDPGRKREEFYVE